VGSLAVALFIVADAPQQSTDNHAAGLAVVILLPPIAVAAAAVLCVGMGAGLVIRRGASRSTDVRRCVSSAWRRA
jgi:hypothetical protein